jgi:hypothetical protein
MAASLSMWANGSLAGQWVLPAGFTIVPATSSAIIVKGGERPMIELMATVASSAGHLACAGG